MILSDRDIRKALESGKVKIESIQPQMFMHIHASSMDLHLGDTFKLIEETLPSRPWFLTKAEVLGVTPDPAKFSELR